MVESRQGLEGRKGGRDGRILLIHGRSGWRGGVARPPPVCLHPFQDKLTIIITFLGRYIRVMFRKEKP